MSIYRGCLAVVLLGLPLLVAAGSDTGLLEAVKKGDHARLQALLKDKSIDVNATQTDGSTALHWAAHRNDLQAAELLLKAGAKPAAANIYKVSPLHLACTNRSDDVALALIQAGADAKAALLTGETALMECARTGAAKAVAAMLKAGTEVDAKESGQGQTALMWAAGMGHFDVVKLLLEHGADANMTTAETAAKVPNTCRICSWKPSPGGFTALLFAARSGDLESARLLVQAGADPNAATAEDGNSLVIASASGHEDVALFLLQSGAKTDVADDNGVTALHYAFYNGLSRMHGYTYDPVYRVRPPNMPKLAQALLEAGADPNARIARNYSIGPEIRGSCESLEGTSGATPFILAAASADAPMLNLLAKFEADVNLAMEDGTTPLIAAARSSCTLAHQRGDNSNAPEAAQSLEAVKTLVGMGLDLNQADSRGNTPLHMSAFSGAGVVAQYLAEKGADINVRNQNGETPWTMASGISPTLQGTGSYGTHEDTAALLLKLGAEQITLSQIERQASSATSNVSIIRDPDAGDVNIGQ